MDNQLPDFLIRNIPIFGKTILAPMDGYSDLPFRSLAREFGSSISYTEFINAMEVIPRFQERVKKRIAYLPSERPVVFQILDNNPQRIFKAAELLQQFGPDMIDINMGCSAKDVSGRGAGAGLLRTPDKVAEIFSTLSKHLHVPVTGKIRLGWDFSNRNYLDIAHIIEDNGGQLIAVHGRTRQQAYTGKADWDAIAEIKKAVKIPVIANGDVRTTQDIANILERTGADAVMIGRGATTNPWIFKGLDRNQVSDDDVYSTLQRHLVLNIDFYGEQYGLVLFRKYAVRYLRMSSASRDARTTLLTCTDPQKFLEIATAYI